MIPSGLGRLGGVAIGISGIAQLAQMFLSVVYMLLSLWSQNRMPAIDLEAELK